MTDEYEVERTASREEAATVLHGLADGVATGAVRLGSGDDERTVDVPEHVDLGIEFETEDGELSLEVELEWPEGTEHDTGDRRTGADEKPAEREDDPDIAAPDSIEDVEGVPTEEPGPPEADHPPTEEGGGPPAAEGSDEVADLDAEGTPAGIAEPAGGATARQVSLGRFELFEDRGGEWRWRLVHRNGNVIATSGEGYTRKHNARKGLRSVMRNAEGAEVTERPDE